ncbi:MAG: ABC transporter substrate-binding protein [Trueperaceae bacterium]|nr:ABC transporter substrate-binding protein [Trueperaceae bacterium]
MQMHLERLGVLALALALLAGVAMAQNEAPALSELVEAGALPSVEERLPDAPLIVEGLDGIGRYGGIWRMGDARGADEGFLNFVGYEGLTRLTPDGDVVPNVVESIEANEDASVYTLTLRPGMRWSDGELLTAEDFAFWHQILADTRLNPTPPEWLAPGGQLGRVEVLDDHTVRIAFSQPHALFQLQAARWSSVDVPYPKHYLSQFYVETADQTQLESRIAEAGLSTWTELWELRQNALLNTERPVLRPWVLDRGYGEDMDAVTYSRNPYYWKVDAEGKQLPYLDGVDFRIVQDVQVLNLMALEGSFDWQAKDVVTLDQLSLYRDNEERGNYRLVEVQSAASSFAAYYLNLSHRDDELRALFHEADFRKALSHAIDRQEIVDLVHFGVTTPRQPAPFETTPFYSEKLENVALEYDPDRANALLDGLGLTARNADGVRLLPDGRPLRLLIQGPAGRQARLDATEQVAQYWTDVGVQTSMTVNSRELHEERRQARDFDVFLWSAASGTTTDALFDPGIYLPYSLDVNSTWALDYAQWRLSNGESGREPTGDMRRSMDLFEQVLQTGDPEEQAVLMRQIMDIAAENLWVFGIAPRPPEFAVVNVDLRNHPLTMVAALEVPGMFNPETWWFDR